MRVLRTAILLCSLPLGATADPIRVVDLTGGSPGLPVAAALENLGNRVAPDPAGDVSQLPAGSILVLDGASDLGALQGEDGRLADFVSRGGGVLVAGLPDTLPATAGLWRALGVAAPADVPSADLFPDDSGNWMWIPTQAGEQPDHTRYIRKGFTVEKAVKRASVRCTADNLCWAYLNGDPIGDHWSWYDHEVWDITDQLRQGLNVLSVKARNVDGPGGFFAQVGIEYQYGTRELIASDQTWLFHISEEPNWTAADFDDSSWGLATNILPMAQHTSDLPPLTVPLTVS